MTDHNPLDTSMSRPFAPVAPGSALVGRVCPLCNNELAVGDTPTLIGDVPANAEEAERKRQGLPYTAEADVAHWSCVTGSDDPLGDFRAWRASHIEAS